MSKRKTTEQKWHEQSEATREEAAKLPCGELREKMLRKAVSYTPLFPDQSVAMIARPTGPHVTNDPRARLSWRRDQRNLFLHCAVLPPRRAAS